MFTALQGMGYTSHTRPRDLPRLGDVLVLWNRYPHDESLAHAFEKVGGHVIVVENGFFGRDFKGSEWYAMARSQHNGAGEWPDGDKDRWLKLGVKLAPWRQGGNEIVILASRGLGSRAVAEPSDWLHKTGYDLLRRTRRPIRVRKHPGPQANCSTVSLKADLVNAHAVVTWGSGAALKALTMGIPVFYGFDKWIGADAARPLKHDLEDPFLDDREPMFHRVATAMRSLDEIKNGEAFRCLL